MSSCTATGEVRQIDLPAASEVLPPPESLTAYGADPSWRYDTDAYPYTLDEALKGRDLPHVQISYTTAEGIPNGVQFVASLFEAGSPVEAREFWAEHGPDTVYTRSIMLDDVPEAGRGEALRFARHNMTDQRPDESWTVICLGGTQMQDDNSDCDDLAVWVTWCSKVLELRIGLDLEYRTPETDEAVRGMVDDIRRKAGC